MNYEIYRRSTLGECLTDALDELIQSGQITAQLAMRVLLQFDKTMNDALSAPQLNRIRMTIKGSLNTYRYCDEVWTFVIDNATIKMDNAVDLVSADRIKIIACSAKKSAD